MAKDNYNINVWYLKLIGVLVLIPANALPGIALGQLYYIALMHSGPGGLAARVVSAIVIFIIMLLLIAIISGKDENAIGGLLIIAGIFTLIVAALIPAHILEIITWIAVAVITIIIIAIALESITSK